MTSELSEKMPESLVDLFCSQLSEESEVEIDLRSRIEKLVDDAWERVKP